MQGKGFSIYVPISKSNQKNKGKIDSSQRSLQSIIAENQIREQNLEYQRLLIERKQLQIQLVQHQNHYQALAKARKKVENTFQNAISDKQAAIHKCKDKKCYLDKYYEMLDKKFRSGKEDLFNSLKKLEQHLLQTYRKDEQQLKESLKAEEEEYNRLASQVNVQRQRRNHLRQQFQNLQRAHENTYGLKQSGLQEREELRSENAFLKEEIDKLNKQKKHLQTQERIMRRILNIQEEHRKHSLIIEGGIKKMFTIRIKQQKYKEAVSPDYAKNLSGLKEIIAKRKQDKEAMFQQIDEKNSKLQRIVREVANKSLQYGRLEDEHMKQQD